MADLPTDVEYYHTMEVPGFGLARGQWDLRGIVDKYLGNVSFAGKRVLEIGPASGFLTIEMEKRGASVVAVEVPDDPGWDYVPFPESVLAPTRKHRRATMARIKKAWWHTRKAYNSSARIVYANVYDLPDDLGSFDIALMGAVLLHTRAPLAIVEQCARRASTIVISDLYCQPLEGQPVCRLLPTTENKAYDAWWQFSTDLFRQFLTIMGFGSQHLSVYEDPRGIPLFTLTAVRPSATIQRK